jgi:hypothetical protein
MATISTTLPSDGQTIDAADVNTPINAIITQVNGNLDSDNIAEGGVIPNALVDGAGTSWVWQSWTPTWTNLTTTSGTISGSYIQIGKTVIARYSIVLGASSAVGSIPSFTLPVTAATQYGTTQHVIGEAHFNDANSNDTIGPIVTISATEAKPQALVQDVTYLRNINLTASIPFTWTTTDYLTLHITYEAA